MAGLLDFMQSPGGIGLLSAVAGGMAGARRGTPWNNAGRGLVAGLTGYTAAQDQIRQDADNKLMQEYKALQMQQIRDSIAAAQAQKQWRAGLPAKIAESRDKVEQFTPDDPFNEGAATFGQLYGGEQHGQQASGLMANVTPGNPQALQEYLMQPDSSYADKLIEQQLIPKPAKWTVVERYNERTGMPEKVLMDENNPSDIRPFGGAQADTVVADNLGGQLVYRGSRSATPLGVAQRTVSPDAQLSAATTRRGQDISNANAAAARAVTIRGQDLPPKAAKGGPMSVTLQKELLESDDIAQSSTNVVRTLDAALKINDKAYSGYGAKPRAVLRSNLPGQSEAADATINLDNMMTGQALESLKMIFGGMPTEGERKILLDMQASADKTPAQRKAILERAKVAAQRRGQYAAQKARAIRNGSYLTEGVGMNEQPAAPSAGGVKFLGFE